MPGNPEVRTLNIIVNILTLVLVGILSIVGTNMAQEMTRIAEINTAMSVQLKLNTTMLDRMESAVEKHHATPARVAHPPE